MKVAIKKIPKAFDDLVDAKRIVREIKLLGFFDHDNIITLLDIERPPARTRYDDIYIITDLMETDMHRVIYSKQAITDEHIQYFLYQALRGVLYMHSANIIHRDLKPSNLLLNKNCDLKI
jgi:mitogen-activated protein kinase 1/3